MAGVIPWILIGLVLPYLIAAGVLLLLCRWLPGHSRWRLGLAWVLGLGLAYVVGHGAIEGWPSQDAPWYPPVEASGWLALVFVPIAAVLLSLASLPTLPRWLMAAFELILAAGLPPLLLRPVIRNQWSAGESAAWLAGLGVAVFASAWSIGSQARRTAGPWLPLTMAAVTAVAAMTFIFSGSVSIGDRGLSLAAALAGAWLASLMLTIHVGLAGGMTLAAPILAGLTIESYFFGSLELPYALLLAASLWTGWVVELPMLRRLKPWQKGTIRLAVMLLPVAVACIWAAVLFSQNSES